MPALAPRLPPALKGRMFVGVLPEFRKDPPEYLRRAAAQHGDIVNLKIYKAVRIDSVWKDLDEFPFNSDNYNTGHPAN